MKQRITNLLLVASMCSLLSCTSIDTSTGTDNDYRPAAVQVTELSSKGNLRTELTEFERPRLGKVRIETTYRGDDEILQVMRFKNHHSRSLFCSGNLMYVESDEDGDGSFESVTVFGHDFQHLEAFTRHPDGSVEPVDDREAELLQEGLSLIPIAGHAVIGEYMEGEIDADESYERMLDYREQFEAIKQQLDEHREAADE